MSAALLLAVFVGGGTGAAGRYGVGRFVGERYGGAFPLGTCLINVTGCFALGLLATALAATRRDVALPTALLGTGFLGGYTTFSTFGWGADLLAGHGAGGIALADVVASAVGGAAAAGAGMAAGREVVVALERAAVGLLGRLDERVLRQRGTARRESEAGTREDRQESA